MNNNIEIMAPVGSFESLHAAINAGVNSIYFGIEQLNMRAKSSNNFTINDLIKIVDICNKNKIKSYLTVNTIIYDHDINIMKKIVDTAKKSGITAIIASDQSVINYTRSVDIELHISTQLNVSNFETVKFYAKFADVIVLARELSLKQIAYITKKIKEENIKGPSNKLLQIEIFVHGALCMAISGKCYLSLHEQNSSANRGACLQTCRKAYSVKEKESGYELEIDNEYIMSPKDLSTIYFVDKIIESGVTILKIEGRARPPEYVKTVTECYKEAVNAVFEGNYTEEKIKIWETRLKTVFNRDFWDGYYLGRKLGEWSNRYGSQATKRKTYIGKGTNYFAKIGIGEFFIQAGELKIGDEILITGTTTGVIKMIVKELRFDGKKTDKVLKKQTISMPVPKKIRRSDKLYKLIDCKV